MLPRLAETSAAQAGAFTRSQALAAGYSADEIRARVRAGYWRRLRHGVFEVTAAPNEAAAHLRRCWAAVLASGPHAVVAGPSACVVHGIRLVALPDAVHLASPHPRSATGIVVRRLELSSSEVERVDGLPVTTLARTAVDTARILDHEAAVVAVDGALHRGTFTRQELEAMLGDGRDVVRARRVIQFADGRSDSVGESLARVALDAAGLPTPELQAAFVGASGHTYRVDFCWPEQRTIGEFDGRVKYADGSMAVVHDEKFREDELRALGFAFVRFGMREVRQPLLLGQRVRAAFVRGRQFAA